MLFWCKRWLIIFSFLKSIFFFLRWSSWQVRQHFKGARWTQLKQEKLLLQSNGRYIFLLIHSIKMYLEHVFNYFSLCIELKDYRNDHLCEKFFSLVSISTVQVTFAMIIPLQAAKGKKMLWKTLLVRRNHVDPNWMQISFQKLYQCFLTSFY